MTRARLALLLAFVLGVPTAAAAGSSPVCGDATFVVQGEPLRERSGLVPPDTIAISGGRIALGSGGSARAKLRASREGTLVRARFEKRKPWFPASTGTGPWANRPTRVQMCMMSWMTGCGPTPALRLKAVISSDCQVMAGTLTGGSERIDREFVALAASVVPPPCDAACGEAGECAPPPFACPEIWLPVCGCDGATYSSACHAAAAGVSIVHDGECGGECGTIVGIPCGAGAFCEMPANTCSSADLGGTCVPIPDVCTQNVDPVCGCDGVTYYNDCARLAALVNKAHDGSCGSRR
jgi:hypothetical protein